MTRIASGYCAERVRAVLSHDGACRREVRHVNRDRAGPGPGVARCDSRFHQVALPHGHVSGQTSSSHACGSRAEAARVDDLRAAVLALDRERRRERARRTPGSATQLVRALRADRRQLGFELLEVALREPAAEAERDPVAERLRRSSWIQSRTAAASSTYERDHGTGPDRLARARVSSSEGSGPGESVDDGFGLRMRRARCDAAARSRVRWR